MIITCPECTSQFLVDRIEFGSGTRKVHCSVCDYAWRQPFLDDEPRRRPAARTARRLYEMPPEIDSGPREAVAGELETIAETGAAPAGLAVDASPEQSDFISNPPDVGTAADSNEPSNETKDRGPDVAAAGDVRANATEMDGVGADDEIDFESEGADSDQSETNNKSQDQDQDNDLGDETRPERESTDAENDGVAALARSSKYNWRRWAIPATAAAGIALVIGGLMLAKDGIVRAFPGWASAYDAIGLSSQPVVGAGLEFHQVTSRREWSGPEEVLIVRGKIANVTEKSVSLPLVRVALYDGDDSEVQAVTVANALAAISPGEEIPFEARIPGPAASAQRIRVSFDALAVEQASSHGSS